MNISRSLVITSISSPNKVLREYAEYSRDHNIDFILVGDKKSPENFFLQGSDYWSIKRQLESKFKTAREIPENHYARKNIGYLAAIERGHEVIIETDDDNFPHEDFWKVRDKNIDGWQVQNTGWINVFSMFTAEKIWPRGYPIEYLSHSEAYDTVKANGFLCPIQQGLADDNPDVDAIFRLTRMLPVKFQKDLTVILGKDCWCPFNSQNTIWFREAFPLLYLPSKCSFRMTDIWRSFVAQRIAWEYGWGIAFSSPTVFQERNEHNLLKDFEDEVPGYLNNAAIGRELGSLNLSGRLDDIYINLVTCYQALIEMEIIGKDEINILHSWNNDVQKLI